jgi:hypothetical protein
LEFDFSFSFYSANRGESKIKKVFGEFLFCEDAVEASLDGYKEPKNIAHVTNYARIGLAPMLRTERDEEHEMSLALQQCGRLVTVGLIVLFAHMSGF